MLGISILLALLADRLFGEVIRGHPLIAFGKIANRVEASSRQWAVAPAGNASAASSEEGGRLQWAGTLAWAFLVIPLTVLMFELQSMVSETVAILLGIIVLYFCIGMRSLAEHARAVAQPLTRGNLDDAREKLSRIVSRDTASLDSQSISQATVESVLENGSDAVLAPIFWFAVAGAPGVLCYRLTNTLDAMWGYRNERYNCYGRTAAKMDDVLNWIPARCCALAYAAVGRYRGALRCWRTQAVLHDSPNAGPVMAAGAGALGILLGGTATYNGQSHWRPTLGEGSATAPEDIERALALVWRAVGVWLLVLVFLEFLVWT
jgi:adenosylcobinamide-phosphate synthase